MESAMTLTVAVAGLFFSFACALLLEELLFGGIFRLFFGGARDSQVSAEKRGANLGHLHLSRGANLGHLPRLQLVPVRALKKAEPKTAARRDDNYYL